MKLGTLLAAGKSLGLGRNGESPFHPDKRFYLPKFISPRNPFAAAATKAPESAARHLGNQSAPNAARQAEAPERRPVPTLLPSSNRNGAAGGQKDTDMNGSPRERQAETPANGAALNPLPVTTQKAAPAKPVVRRPAWVSHLNPFGGGQSPSASQGKAVMQSELSLDTVKVLRNDLRDVDVEVVPLKSRSGGGALVPAVVSPKKPWSFFGERLFKVETT